MKRFLGTLTALALLASPAAAQDGTFDFISGTTNQLDFQGQWVAPQGSIIQTLNTPFAIFCVDQNNFAISNPAYPAWSTTIADNNALIITHTRLGQTLGEQTAYERYWRAAFLVEQYLLLPPVQSAAVQQAYQFAIWNITNGNLNNNFGNSIALTNTALLAPVPVGGVSQWAVITDLNTVRGQGGSQEFIWVGQGGREEIVPEPATMTLLATGLAGMAAANRRRKNKK